MKSDLTKILRLNADADEAAIVASVTDLQARADALAGTDFTDLPAPQLKFVAQRVTTGWAVSRARAVAPRFCGLTAEQQRDVLARERGGGFTLEQALDAFAGQETHNATTAKL